MARLRQVAFRRIVRERFFLGPRVLSTQRPSAAVEPLSILSPLTVGLAGQEWCPYSVAEASADQRQDDAGSLCFDTAPLAADLWIVGVATLALRIAADAPQAMVAARLTSVAPDGVSALITYGLLNLSHRDSHEHPAALTPDDTKLSAYT